MAAQVAGGRVIASALAAAALLAAPLPAPSPPRLVEPAPAAVASTAFLTVFIQPLGRALPDADVEMVGTALREFYGVEVKVLPRIELPKEAWYPPRKRWRADRLLDFLAPRVPHEGAHILGLTSVDISTTKGEHEDWGVVGLGDLSGATSVISSFRCAKKSKGLLNTRERLAKSAVHEMGHNLGLDHCPTVGCIVRDAEGQVARSDEEYDLCAKCRGLLERAGRRIPEHPRIPWAKPKPAE